MTFSIPNVTQLINSTLTGQTFSIPPGNFSSLPALQQNSTQIVELTVQPSTASSWGVYTLDNEPVFDIDSCVDFKFADQAKTSDFPVEEGGFASYNKVIEPFQPRVKLAVHGDVRISNLLTQLYIIVRSTNVYNVYTPSFTYLNVTLDKYDYSRTAKDGQHFVQVELTLKQINQVSPSYSTVKIVAPKKPHAKDKIVDGKVVPTSSPNIYNLLDSYGSQLGIGNTGTGTLGGKSGINLPPRGH